MHDSPWHCPTRKTRERGGCDECSCMFCFFFLYICRCICPTHCARTRVTACGCQCLNARAYSPPIHLCIPSSRTLGTVCVQLLYPSQRDRPSKAELHVGACVRLSETITACRCVNARACLASTSSSSLPRDLLLPFPRLGLPPRSVQRQQQRALPPQRPSLTRSPLRRRSVTPSVRLGWRRWPWFPRCHMRALHPRAGKRGSESLFSL